MNFTWHEIKRRTNLRDHGFNFADVPQAFEGPTSTFEDERYNYDEQRFITLGLLRGQVVVIAHTERNDTVRVISMRKGTKREPTFYFGNLAN